MLSRHPCWPAHAANAVLPYLHTRQLPLTCPLQQSPAADLLPAHQVRRIARGHRGIAKQGHLITREHTQRHTVQEAKQQQQKGSSKFNHDGCREPGTVVYQPYLQVLPVHCPRQLQTAAHTASATLCVACVTLRNTRSCKHTESRQIEWYRQAS